MACDCEGQRDPVTSMADLKARIEPSRAIRPRLSQVRDDPANWRTLFRCRVCGSYWIEEYPWSELQGGGPTVLLPVLSSDASAYLRSSADLVPALLREQAEIRRKLDDKEFWVKLGAEIGPKACNEPGCGRLRIELSVCCRRHHFMMIKGRAPPAG